MASRRLPIEVHDLTVSYQKKPVLYGIDLEIEEGSLVGVLGPNGAGKSTLVKSVMNMIKPNGGYVKIFGKDPKEGIKQIGYVPQRESVDWDFPVTVMDVVLMGRYGHVGWFGRLGKKDHHKASECLEQVNMLPYADRQIGNLSGGQQQRVFLARALAQESAIYLMDEPFAGVDPISISDIKAIINHLKERGLGVLITDHNVRETLDICERAYIVSEGQVIADGDAQSILDNTKVQKVYLGKDFRL